MNRFQQNMYLSYASIPHNDDQSLGVKNEAISDISTGERMISSKHAATSQKCCKCG